MQKKGVAKVPVVMQMEALECGAACLTMILEYYRKFIPLEQVRLDCGVSRDGSNAKNIILAARNYGLTARAYKMEPETLAVKGSFPCIVHWNFDHFIVVCGMKKDKVYINDPARGHCVIEMEEFDQAFTGVCMLFDPSETFEPSGSKVSMVKYAISRMKGASVAALFVLITTVITSLLGMIAPGFTRVFTDFLLEGRNPRWVPYFMAGLIVFSALQLYVAYLQALYSCRMNGKMAVVGNTTYLWKVLHLPMEFFSQRYAGDIQMRQSANASIAAGIVETFAPLVLKAAMMIVYLVIMIRYSVWLSMIGILSILVNVLMSNYIAKKRINITRVQMLDEGKLAGMTVSGIEMIETVKSSGAENGFFQKWAGYQAGVNASRVEYVETTHHLGLIPEFASMLADLAILFIGVILTVEGKFSIGMLMAFQGLLASFSEPAHTLISAGQSLQELRTSMERIEDVMSYPADANAVHTELEEGVDYKKLTGNVSVRNVTFGYSRMAEPLINDFNLELEPGKSIAIVGDSGCGKSTIAKLLSGLYGVWSGEILYDGKPISEINHRVFTGSVAVVDQEITLYEDTIANNIKMWDKSIEDFEMIMAAKDAQIHDAITQRNGGYEYMLTEGGKDFSGGERQRIELARVLAQDPTVIILDEATSALDARTEYDVVRAIRNRGITCVVIAHRLSTVRHCDEILVMHKGTVVERGTHDELFARGGLYTELVTNE